LAVRGRIFSVHQGKREETRHVHMAPSTRPRRKLRRHKTPTTQRADYLNRADAYWFIAGGLQWCWRCETREKYYAALERLP